MASTRQRLYCCPVQREYRMQTCSVVARVTEQKTIFSDSRKMAVPTGVSQRRHQSKPHVVVEPAVPVWLQGLDQT